MKVRVLFFAVTRDLALTEEVAFALAFGGAFVLRRALALTTERRDAVANTGTPIDAGARCARGRAAAAGALRGAHDRVELVVLVVVDGLVERLEELGREHRFDLFFWCGQRRVDRLRVDPVLGIGEHLLELGA